MNIFKNIRQMLLPVSIVAISACNNKNQNKMNEQNITSLFPKGKKQSNEWFTGNAWLQPLLARNNNNDFALGSVTFEPGARTLWHIHPKGQVLIVTEGEGIYQEKEKPAQIIKKGDVINIPEDVEHWHGASDNSKMAHIAITNYKGEQNVTWLKPVTDEEFKEANKQ
jgi:4-carboxymuconolactone decarboxylase